MPSRKKELDALFHVLKVVVLSTVFESVSKEIAGYSPSERLQAAFKLFTVEEFKARGFQMPEGFTFTTFSPQDPGPPNDEKTDSVVIEPDTVLGFKIAGLNFWLRFFFTTSS